jgi:GNAT superfamily N-acetyltransferase
MKVTVKEVVSRRELKAFVHFPNKMYKKEQYYVPTLEKADLDALDQKKNHAFEVCEAKYWMAFDESGKAVGRIAGIINRQYNEKTGLKQARFGFLDFIDDKDVVKALFDTSENWAREKGMTTVSGPLGFLEFDAAGVLVMGFDQLPTCYGKYNFPYYEPRLLELGYTKETDWIESIVTVPFPIPDRYERGAKLISERYKLHGFAPKSKKEMVGHFSEMAKLLNKAYSDIHGFSELSDGQIEDLKKQFVPNLNPGLVGIVADENDKIVGFGISIPSLAKAMQKAKGRLFPFGFIHLYRALRHNDTLDSLLIAVDDEYKGKGVNSLIFTTIAPAAEKIGIKYLETTRELEDNESVQNLWNSFEHRTVKRARCYHKDL